MEHRLNHALVREFARKLFGLHTSRILTLLVDVGHRTGLFGAVAEGPGTRGEIATRSQLQERYVREWLERTDRPANAQRRGLHRDRDRRRAGGSEHNLHLPQVTSRYPHGDVRLLRHTKGRENHLAFLRGQP